jgi:predicted dehydrogenase
MLRAAIVGLGRWGQNLVNSVHGKSDAIRFTAGATRTVEKAAAYAREKGFPLHDSYEKVLADPDIDAVVLATPHTQHAQQVVAAAKAGKHVFTEKPLALTLASAREATQACADAGVTLAVGYNWRFQPALREIRRMLEDGRLGKLLHLEGNFCGPSAYRFPAGHWRHEREEGPAGGMTGRGVHTVDAYLYLAGHVASVHAQSFRRTLDYGLDDTTSMLFEFGSGATGYLGTVLATAETWRMQVFGSTGWVEVGDVQHLTTWEMKVCYVNPQDLLVHHKPEVMTFPAVSTERAELESFAHAVERKHALAVPGGDEEHGVAVLEAVMKSAETRKSVRIAKGGKARNRTARTPRPPKETS